jgi:hypothetical protein
MEMTFSHLLAGITGFAATAVTPRFSFDSGVIRNDIVSLLSFLILWLAIAVFQRSIKQKGKQAPEQGQATESEMLQTLEQAIEEGRASLDLDVAASPTTHQETPSPLAEFARQFDKALPDPLLDRKTEPDRIAQSALNGTNGNAFAHPPANPAREETARVSLPRLSELRGMRFSQALRELDRAKRSAPANAGLNSLNGSLNSSLNAELDDTLDDPINEILMSAIAPFEPIFAPAASAPEAQNVATAMNKNGAQGSPPQQTFFPTKPSLPAKSRGYRGDDSARSPRDPKSPGKETGGFLDQLHILPSRRGQYKKKG